MSTLLGQSLGQYQILDFLGEGGVAHVYRARRISEKKDVAIKVIKPGIIDLNDLFSNHEYPAKASTVNWCFNFDWSTIWCHVYEFSGTPATALVVLLNGLKSNHIWSK